MSRLVIAHDFPTSNTVQSVASGSSIVNSHPFGSAALPNGDYTGNHVEKRLAVNELLTGGQFIICGVSLSAWAPLPNSVSGEIPVMKVWVATF